MCRSVVWNKRKRNLSWHSSRGRYRHVYEGQLPGAIVFQFNEGYERKCMIVLLVYKKCFDLTINKLLFTNNDFYQIS